MLFFVCPSCRLGIIAGVLTTTNGFGRRHGGFEGSDWYHAHAIHVMFLFSMSPISTRVFLMHSILPYVLNKHMKHVQC